MASVAKAFELLGYSAGYLNPAESQQLGGARPGPNWQVVDKDVVSRILEVNGEKIGLIFFPSIKKEEKAPSEDLRAKINREAAKLRPQVRIILGVSPWGAVSEREYLASKPDIDVLCGAGPGFGSNFQPSEDAKVLWGRAFGRGRAVNSFDVLAWPSEKGFAWKDKENYQASILSLDETTPENIQVSELLNSFQQEKETPAQDKGKKPVR